MFKSKLIAEMTTAEIRLMRVLVRRYANALARSRGFRNAAEMEG